MAAPWIGPLSGSPRVSDICRRFRENSLNLYKVLRKVVRMRGEILSSSREGINMLRPREVEDVSTRVSHNFPHQPMIDKP